ncbi:MAG: leucine-rich repeat domain-containing protein, partial [Promethearchaeota archaeon]
MGFFKKKRVITKKYLKLRGDPWGKKSIALVLEGMRLEPLDDLRFDFDPRIVEIIYLNGNYLKRISNLEHFKNLRVLWMGGNRIEKIENLEALTELRVLDINANQLTRIEGLESLEKLKKLILNLNKIEKIEGLENLRELEELIL